MSVLDLAEARRPIDAIDTTIGLMVYSFGRIGAAISMRVEDVYPQNRRLWVRLHEKGGKQHAIPCHHNLECYLHEYIDGAGLAKALSRRRQFVQSSKRGSPMGMTKISYSGASCKIHRTRRIFP